MKICVVGGGAAGLCAARHISKYEDRVDQLVVYEASDQVGGTWNYTPAVGKDEYELPIHSAMYRDLR